MDTELIADLLELIMLICFGASWPVNTYNNWKARTAKGSNWQFLAMVTAGYIAGVFSHLIGDGSFNWIIIAYLINIAFIIINLLVYFRNCKLDKIHDLERAEKVLDFADKVLAEE